jgi:hypothetical protein
MTLFRHFSAPFPRVTFFSFVITDCKPNLPLIAKSIRNKLQGAEFKLQQYDANNIKPVIPRTSKSRGNFIK